MMWLAASLFLDVGLACLFIAACNALRGLCGSGITKALKPNEPAPLALLAPAVQRPAPWWSGCTAFWLDPDLWHGIEDTHRTMCWMKLDQRPAPEVSNGDWMAEVIDCSDREALLAALAVANHIEGCGQASTAARLRHHATRQFRAARSRRATTGRPSTTKEKTYAA